MATILRFYRFPNRWGLLSDDARDVLIAKEALGRHELPLFGSFSSAGPFVFGPLFYWYIMSSYLLFPDALTIPWVILGFLGILTVLLAVKIGNVLAGRRFGLLIGLVTAYSPQLISRALVLNQHSLISFLATLTLLFLILLWKEKRLIYAFLSGLSIGAAISLHYQALNLLIVVISPLLIPMRFKKKLMCLIAILIGIFIPSVPLLYWDWHQDFANTRNIIDYFLIGQYRLYVPNSWKLFLFSYFPSYWAFVAGGSIWIGRILFYLAGIFVFIQFLRKKVDRLFLVLGMFFAFFMILNRYYRGERSEGYLIYLSPFILLFTAWTIHVIFLYYDKSKHSFLSFFFRTFVLIFGIGIIIGNTFRFRERIFYNNKVDQVTATITKLQNKYPAKMFSIYDYKWGSSTISYPLVVFMADKKLISRDGLPLGVTCGVYKTPIPTMFHEGCKIYDLSADKKRFNTTLWTNVNPASVYDDLITRWMRKKLYSPFHFFPPE
ncbi:glycosyltransferase family 39 protein [Candidatus Gottesmanbacteria bacterium]|nr:glycosyltransferase family 39 protein [Candidatus Gottesmanbacteria bacterium]